MGFWGLSFSPYPLKLQAGHVSNIEEFCCYPSIVWRVFFTLCWPAIVFLPQSHAQNIGTIHPSYPNQKKAHNARAHTNIYVYLLDTK